MTTNPNPTIPVNSISKNPPYPLQRCAGDCDHDGHCDDGLFCMSRDGNEPIPGCTGSAENSWDYCADSSDFNFGFMLLPTGGWDDNWQYSEPLEVSLIGE